MYVMYNYMHVCENDVINQPQQTVTDQKCFTEKFVIKHPIGISWQCYD